MTLECKSQDDAVTQGSLHEFQVGAKMANGGYRFVVIES